MTFFNLIITLFLFSSIAFAETVIESHYVYEVKKGDTLELISSKFGIPIKQIIKNNNIDLKQKLKPGQKININIRKIVPKVIENGVLINIADRTLYYFEDGKLKMMFPVGVGMPFWNGLTYWRTPEGKFKILGKRKNPVWHVPESIQWKMEMEGIPVKTVVPPGDDNPLGKYVLDTSMPGILIHETIFPRSVYRYSSHGCIRMLPEHMRVLFNSIKINTPGEIIYMPVKIAVSETGRVFLEVHKDAYNKFKNLSSLTKKLIEEKGVANLVDWQKINLIIKEKSGVAEDITKTEAIFK